MDHPIGLPMAHNRPLDAQLDNGRRMNALDQSSHTRSRSEDSQEHPPEYSVLNLPLPTSSPSPGALTSRQGTPTRPKQSFLSLRSKLSTRSAPNLHRDYRLDDDALPPLPPSPTPSSRLREKLGLSRLFSGKGRRSQSRERDPSNSSAWSSSLLLPHPTLSNSSSTSSISNELLQWSSSSSSIEESPRPRLQQLELLPAPIYHVPEDETLPQVPSRDRIRDAYPIPPRQASPVPSSSPIITLRRPSVPDTTPHRSTSRRYDTQVNHESGGRIHRRKTSASSVHSVDSTSSISSSSSSSSSSHDLTSSASESLETSSELLREYSTSSGFPWFLTEDEVTPRPRPSSVREDTGETNYTDDSIARSWESLGAMGAGRRRGFILVPSSPTTPSFLFPSGEESGGTISPQSSLESRFSTSSIATSSTQDPIEPSSNPISYHHLQLTLAPSEHPCLYARDSFLAQLPPPPASTTIHRPIPRSPGLYPLRSNTPTPIPPLHTSTMLGRAETSGTSSVGGSTSSMDGRSNVDRWSRAYVNSKEHAGVERQGKGKENGRSVGEGKGEENDRKLEEGWSRASMEVRGRGESRMRDMSVQVDLWREGGKVISTQTELSVFVPSIEGPRLNLDDMTMLELESSKGGMSREEVRAYEGIESLDEEVGQVVLLSRSSLPHPLPPSSLVSTPTQSHMTSKRDIDYESMYRATKEALERESEKNAVLGVKLSKVVSILTNLDRRE